VPRAQNTRFLCNGRGKKEKGGKFTKIKGGQGVRSNWGKRGEKRYLPLSSANWVGHWEKKGEEGVSLRGGASVCPNANRGNSEVCHWFTDFNEQLGLSLVKGQSKKSPGG